MNSREKGKRGEREWASVCREHGWDVRRTVQYCGNTGDASDCVGLPGIHQEVKRVERLDIYGAMAQAISLFPPREKSRHTTIEAYLTGTLQSQCPKRSRMRKSV